jgi:hypothetical protein
MNMAHHAQMNRLGSVKNLRLDFFKFIFAVGRPFDTSSDSYRTSSGQVSVAPKKSPSRFKLNLND